MPLRQKSTKSYIELRLLPVILSGAFALSAAIPLLIWAADLNGDNLDDAWEAQYGFSTNAYAATNLVGWWQLNGTNSSDHATDQSGHGVDGSLNGFPTAGYSPGLFSNALNFSTNSTVNFPTTNSVLNLTNGFTYSAWFQSTNSVSRPALIATWEDINGSGWSLGADTNGVATVTFYDGATAQVVEGTNSPADLYDGQWHQVAATLDTNQVAKVYVDGRGEATNTITGWTPSAVASFIFGSDDTNNVSSPFVLDEARLYDRAFGAQEITQLPPTYSDFNGSGLTVYDDYLEGLDPLGTNSTVTSGFIDSGLIGYYGGSLPTLIKSSGDGQVVAASSFASNPLVVQVKDGTGTPLVGAPITFSITSGSDGALSQTSGGSTATSVSLTTDASGNATVYYQAGPDTLQNNTISAKAVSTSGSISVTFTAYCGAQSGLALWLRADQGVTADGSGNISQWVDQSVSGHDIDTSSVSGVGAPVMGTDSGGKPAMLFEGNKALSTSDSIPVNGDVTLISVVSADNPQNFGVAFSVGGSASYEVARAYAYRSGQPVFDVYQNSAQAGTAANPGEQAINTVTYTRSSGAANFYLRGALTGSANVGVNDVASGFIVGDGVWYGNPWAGTISEILVYDGVLTSSQQQQVEVYLADKYKLYHPDATWPLVYSSDVQAQITAHQWNKPQADAYAAFLATSPPIPASGVVAWLKADAGVTADGSGSVSAWADQGPNSYAADQSNSGQQPTIVSNAYNGKPTIRFNGSSQYLQIPSLHDGYSSGLSIFAVYNPTSTASWARVLDFGNGPGADNILVARQATGPNFFVQAYQGSSNAFNVSTSDLATSKLQEYSVVDDPASQANVYKNGVVSASATGSAPDSATRTSNFIGKSNWSGDSLFQGDISELIIYNRPLTSGEREQVEGYLADRYGLFNPNSTWPAAYSSEVQALITSNQWSKGQADAYVAFAASSPVPASGLSLWLKADAGVTADVSGNVGAWADQSPNGNNAGLSSGSQVTVISSGTGGKPMLHFNGSNWMAIPDAASLRPNYITVLAVAQENSSATYQTLISRAYRNSSGWGYPYVSWDMCLFGVNGGNYLRSAVSTGGNLTENNAGNNYDLSQPHIFGWQYDGTAQKVFLEGVETASTATSGALDYGGGTANICIGARSDASPGETVNADVSEILVYDHVLSSDDEAQAESYLADKYGLNDPNATWPLAYSSEVQAEINRNKWSKAQADAYVAFQSANPTMLTNGLKLWLKADAGVNQDGSGNVDSWTDQTGNFTVSQSGGVRPTYVASDVNGKPALHFNGGQTLYNPASLGAGANSDMTIISVCSSYNPGAQQYSIYLGNTGGYANRGLGFYASRQIFDLSNGNYSLGAGTPPPNTFVADGWTLASNLSDVTFYRNGYQTGTAAMGSVQNISPGITIGGYNGYGTPWQGDIAEVLVYDHQLSADELSQVNGYLADKYGFDSPDATWPLAYSSEVQTEISHNQWTKAQADNYVTLEANNSTMLTHGLLFWCKADAGVTQDGSGNVSSWADQTGNYTVTQGTGGNMPTYVASDINGMPGLHFNGGQWLYNGGSMGPGINADISIITVASTSNPGALEYTLFLGNGAAYVNRGVGYYQSRDLIDICNGYALGASSPASNTFVAEAFTLNSSLNTATFYRNGSLTATPSVGGLGNVTPGVKVGAPSDQYAPWQGDISEILVYDHQLSSDELEQVGVYLADKYGLYHPDATWPQAYSSEVQAEITRNQWSKTQADSYVALQNAHPDMLTDGILLWLKADAGVTADGSGNVSAWADQTGNFNLTQGAPGNEPALITNDLNGKPALHFNGNQWLHDANSIGAGANADVTMILVASTSSPGAQQYGLWLGATGTGYNRGLGYYNWSQIFDTYNIYTGGSGAPAANSFVVEAGTLSSDRTTMTLYQNGTETTSNGSLGGIQNIQPGVSIGTLYGAGYNWQGDIAEALVYDHQLSSDELQQVGVYLADKYGLYNPDATWPLAYSSDVQALITANLWSKAQADAYVAFQASLAAFAADHPDMVTNGLTMWLEADGSVTSDGSGYVSQWADQTPYANNANQGSSGNRPTLVATRTDLNGKPVIHFNGSNNFLDVTDNASLRPSGGVTLIAVAQTYSNSQQEVVDRTLTYGAYGDYWNAPLYSYELGMNNNNVERGYIGANGGGDLGGALGRAHRMAIASMVYDGTNQTLSDGEVQQATAALSGAIDYNSPNEHDLYLGVHNGYFGLGGYLNGDIAEVLVYNRALTTSERQEVEGYLADKYGVYDANATWTSVYSSDVQALITANGWSKAEADAYVAFVAAGQPVAPSGLVVWLKADSGVTADGGGKVSTWGDQTVFQNNAVQGSTGNQPTLITSTTGLNNKPVVRFDGSSSFLAIADNPSLWPSGAVTIIALAQTYSDGQQDIVNRTLNYGSYGDYWNAPLFSYELGTNNNNVERGYVGTSGGADLSSPSGRGHTMSIASMVYDGINQTIYNNGVQKATATVSGAIDYNSPNEHDLYLGVHNGYFGLGGYFNGDVAEVLIYSRALTSAEQQQVEGYLADKYGVYDANATWPSTYSSDVQALIAANEWSKAQADSYVTFVAAGQPVAASGLVVWLKADSGVTADGSGKISAWADQTIFQNNANQGNAGNQPALITSTTGLNGKPVVRFDGSSSYLVIKDNPSLWPSSAVTIIALAQTYSNTQQDIVDRTLIYGSYGDYWDAPLYSYELGTANDNIERGYLGTSGGSDISGAAGRAYQMSVATMICDGTNQTIYDSGVEQATASTTGTIDYNHPNEHDLYVGVHNGYFGLGSYLNGDLAEVLIYNRALTTAEQQQAEGYLADKYGVYDVNATWSASYSSDIQALIASNSWSKAQADAYVAFVAGSPSVSPSGLELWMEADAGVTVDGSGKVSQWVDQGPNAHVAAQITAANQPHLVTDPQTGLAAVNFTGNQSLLGTDYISANQDLTVIAAASQSNLGAVCALGLNPNAAGSMRGYGYFSGHANFDIYLNSVTSGTAPPVAIPEVATMTYVRSSGAVQFFLKGSSTGSATISASDIVPGFSLGSEGWMGGYLTGNISEILIYNRKLSSSEQQLAEVYLADKYGLYHPDATWPSAYSSAIQAEITLHQWNKAQADDYVALQADNTNLPTNGLSLWLRADAGVTTSGSNVTAIADQTGNYTLSQTAAINQPTYVASDLNGLPALRFTGSQWLAGPGTLAPGLNQDMTIITVGMSTNPDVQAYCLSLGQNNGTSGINRAIGYNGSELFDTIGSASLGGLAPTAGAFVAETVTLDSTLTNVTFYQNGVQTSTGTLSSVQNLSSGITLGAAGGGSNGWQGDIAEVLVYDHKLSSTELQQVGTYLTNKYGLYSNTAPVITPAAGSYSSAQTVTISSGLTTGTIHYTIDGTTPTSSSPTYIGAFSLSGSALVSAAVFIDGNIASPVASSQFYIDDPDDTGLAPNPTGLSATAVSANEIDLAWMLASLQTYSHVYVYRSTNGGAYELISVLGPNATSFADTTATAGNSYTYEIGTVNQAGVSKTSASTSISPTAASTLTINVTTPSGAVPLP